MADLGALTVAVRLTAEGLQAGISEVQAQLSGIERGADRVDSAMAGASRSIEQGAAKQAAAFAGIAAAALTAFAAIKGAVQLGTEAYNEHISALKGLESVAGHKQIGQAELSRGLDELTDKFFKTSEASAALKNLLSRGYTLDEAVNTIKRLKDSASFGRQAHLELGEAVVTATQGLKNENSILVDNAGVTKNVSKMWEDYAKSIGKSTAALTQSERVQAEIKGIMEETQAQVGDLAKMGDTLQGAQAGTAAKVKELAANYGAAMAPIVSMGEQVKSTVLEGFNALVEKAPAVASGLTSAAGAGLTLLGVLKGIQALQKGKGLLDQLLAPVTKTEQVFNMVTMRTETVTRTVKSGLASMIPVLGGITLAIGVVSGIVTAVHQMQEAERQRIQQLKSSSEEGLRNARTLEELADKYDELSSKKLKSAQDLQEMAGLESQLASSFKVTAGYVNALTGEYVGLAEAARDAAGAQLEAAKKGQDEVYAAARKDWDAAGRKVYEGGTWSNLNFTENLKDFKARGEKAAKEAIEGMRQELVVGGKKLSESSARTAETVAMAYFNKFAETATTSQGREALLKATQEMFVKALDTGNLDTVAEKVSNATKKIELGEILSQEEIGAVLTGLQGLNPAMAEFSESLGEFEGKDEIINNLLSGLYEKNAALFNLLGVGKDSFGGYLTSLADGSTQMDTYTAKLEGYNQAQDRAIFTAARLQATEEALKNSGTGLFDPLNASTVEAGTHLGTLEGQLESANREITNLSQSGTKASTIKKYVSEFREGKTTLAQFEQNLKSVGVTTKMSADEAEAFADTLGSKTLSSLEATKESLTGYLSELETVAANQNISGEVKVEVDGAISKVKSLISIINTLLGLMGQAGISSNTGKSGGGGGGGKKESEYQKALKALEHDKKMDLVDYNAELGRLLAIRNEVKLTAEEELDLEERIHAVRKKIQEERLRKDYELIEHKKALNQINTEQEVRMLEDMARKHWFTNEQRMEYDRKLYEARERLKREKEEKLSGVGEGLMQALRRQYEAMRDMEMEALDKSLDAFDNWADERVKAIEKQIEMLDKLASKEDEEAKSAEELRKINRLKEAMHFERDEYNRAQLAEQLRQAEAQREERLRKKAQNDEKAALREQIKAIQEEKQAKRASVEEQRKQIEDTYKALTEQISIEAEARKMLLEKSQKDIVAFIGKFAPEYDALGRSLGEKWLKGFERGVGDIFGYFDSFNKNLQSFQDTLTQNALAAVEKFWQGREAGQGRTTVNQTVNFNQPVESPGQAARRLKDVAEELVYGG